MATKKNSYVYEGAAQCIHTMGPDSNYPTPKEFVSWKLKTALFFKERDAYKSAYLLCTEMTQYLHKDWAADRKAGYKPDTTTYFKPVVKKIPAYHQVHKVTVHRHKLGGMHTSK